MTTSLRYAWITAQQDRAEHAVSDDEQAASRNAAGRFTPVCGQSFFAAPMEASPHRRCPACARRMNRPSHQ